MNDCSNGFFFISTKAELGLTAHLLETMPADDLAVFQLIFNGEVRHAFASQGYYALGSSRADTAAHEAGHVVQLAAMGMGVDKALIRRELADENFRGKRGIGRYNWYGLTYPAYPSASFLSNPKRGDRFKLFQALTGFIAGVGGEGVLRQSKFRAGSGLDEISMAILYSRYLVDLLSSQCNTRASVEEVVDTISYFVRGLLVKNVKTLKRVANALEAKRTLGRKQLAKLVADVIPASPEDAGSMADLARLLLPEGETPLP
jgi:hypothetical protein